MPDNQTLVDEAERLTPLLYESEAIPKRLVEVIADSNAFQGWVTGTVGGYEELYSKTFGKSESVTLDFGDHLVGYLSFAVESVGSPPDAPLKLKLIFGEMPCEMEEPFDQYQGWLSSSWLQEETLFLDVLPAVVRLPRRYSFRYLKIQVVDASRKYRVQFTDVRCTMVTSADISKVESLPTHVPEDLKIMDRIAIKTLQDCMQTVYEDGPKRDRRLWIGDLRLQAQANYLTFRDLDVVKRCLYLFGGMTLPDGKIGACVFEKPVPHVDDTWLYDYSLFFVACLYDYYKASLDRNALETLWPIALKQLKLGTERLGSHGVIVEDPTWSCFIDWNDELNKQASAQAVLLYTLKRGLMLARTLEDLQEEQWITGQIEIVSMAALEHLWDSERGVFISGAGKQVSWASQVWMILAEVLPKEECANVMDRLHDKEPKIGMNTPYMYHHYIEALFACGKEEKAWEQLRAYWGEMVADGADTFWELYNPKDKKFSPYGSNLINSYCHAWSCTPTYFIRKYWLCNY